MSGRVEICPGSARPCSADTQQVSACHCEPVHGGPAKGSPLRGEESQVRPCNRRRVSVFSLSLRGAKRRGNPLPRRKSQEKVALKANSWAVAGLPRQHPLAHVATRQSFACHCEERSDVAIRVPAGKPGKLALLWANPQHLSYSPEVFPFAMCCRRRDGLPHQCAHWFAMTCKRRVRFCGCKGWFARTSRRWAGVCKGKGVSRRKRLYPAHGCGVANACQVYGCHCEERSDVAIRNSCGRA